MHVLILYDEPRKGARPDELDALEQADFVAAELRALGHRASRRGVDLDLARLARELEADRPDLVFNLVESLAGHGRLIHLVPSLLDALGVPYTGSPATAIATTSNKPLAKHRMRAAGLPTPAWATLEDLRRAGARPPAERCIVKSVWEHASLGLDEDSVLAPESAAQLAEAIERRLPDLRGEGFAEAFVDGREINVALLARSGEPEVLPPSEILFEGYGEAKPRVVGWRAKWDSASFEHEHTTRSLRFPASDRPLLAELERLARAAWSLFGLRGWARVDFRIDAEGRPWILEVNANPCLAPDAGFAAALAEAAIAPAGAIERILSDATRPGASDRR